MIPADLRIHSDSLDGERGTGGQSKLACLLGWDYSTLWRKLNGKSPITQSDELAIRQVAGALSEKSCTDAADL
jgi:hypothetical protein